MLTPSLNTYKSLGAKERSIVYTCPFFSIVPLIQPCLLHLFAIPLLVSFFSVFPYSKIDGNKSIVDLPEPDFPFNNTSSPLS